MKAPGETNDKESAKQETEKTPVASLGWWSLEEAATHQYSCLENPWAQKNLAGYLRGSQRINMTQHWTHTFLTEIQPSVFRRINSISDFIMKTNYGYFYTHMKVFQFVKFLNLFYGHDLIAQQLPGPILGENQLYVIPYWKSLSSAHCKFLLSSWIFDALLI